MTETSRLYLIEEIQGLAAFLAGFFGAHNQSELEKLYGTIEDFVGAHPWIKELLDLIRIPDNKTTLLLLTQIKKDERPHYGPHGILESSRLEKRLNGINEDCRAVTLTVTLPDEFNHKPFRFVFKEISKGRYELVKRL